MHSQGASLVILCLRLCLSMKGTWVQSLVQEDPTCHKATKSMPQLLSLCFKTTLHKRSHRNEKPLHHNEEQPWPVLSRESPGAATNIQSSQKINLLAVAQTVKHLAYNAGDLGLIPGSGRSSGEGNGNPLQHSCLENPMDRGAWWATVHGVAKHRTQLSDFPFTFTF